MGGQTDGKTYHTIQVVSAMTKYGELETNSWGRFTTSARATQFDGQLALCFHAVLEATA
jgi:hypothetical protein